MGSARRARITRQAAASSSAYVFTSRRHESSATLSTALPKYVPEAASITAGRHTRQAVLGLSLILLAVGAGYLLAG